MPISLSVWNLTDEIDQVISAEIPPVSDDGEDQRYRDLVSA